MKNKFRQFGAWYRNNKRKLKSWLKDKHEWLKTFNHKPRVTVFVKNLDVEFLENEGFFRVNGRMDTKFMCDTINITGDRPEGSWLFYFDPKLDKTPLNPEIDICGFKSKDFKEHNERICQQKKN